MHFCGKILVMNRSFFSKLIHDYFGLSSLVTFFGYKSIGLQKVFCIYLTEHV